MLALAEAGLLGGLSGDEEEVEIPEEEETPDEPQAIAAMLEKRKCKNINPVKSGNSKNEDEN